MLTEGLQGFRGKRILLLQGPMGPFFYSLSKDLKKAGASKVFKINFNGGDCFFYPFGASLYRKGIESWSEYFEAFIVENKIDVVLLFGDCRPLHRIAHQIAEARGIALGAFEEGYLRPDYITLDNGGVNAFSKLSKDPNFYLNLEEGQILPEQKVGNTIYHAFLWCVLYYFFHNLLLALFRQYRHHRSLSPLQTLPQFRSLFRKFYFQIKERGIQEKLSGALSRKYYLVPLQLQGDAQIHVHSKFKNNQDFIEFVLTSFAKHARRDTLLVLKQHPLDRAFEDYTKHIRDCAKKNNVQDRCLYIHDQHLPTLLQHSRGVIVINSTVGLSAIHHGCPLKVCGNALYDMEGLSYQGTLEDFWVEAIQQKTNFELYKKFRNYLIRKTQVNGSFYKRLKNSSYSSGVDWTTCEKATTAKKNFLILKTGTAKEYGQI